MRRALLACSVCALACSLAALACDATLVEDVSTGVCASGKRWVGKLTGDEEMYPGHDCVGCHKDYDGPEFMAAGTVYGVLDQDGSRTINQDCFGLEGAKVTITSGDGQVLETTTNRAGNFFFQGRPDSLVKPFSAVIEYTSPEGRYSREPMATTPAYGGCAHCHSLAATGTAGGIAGDEPGPADIVQGVAPLFTGLTPE
jgi:hypothetical protein